MFAVRGRKDLNPTCIFFDAEGRVRRRLAYYYLSVPVGKSNHHCQRVGGKSVNRYFLCLASGSLRMSDSFLRGVA